MNPRFLHHKIVMFDMPQSYLIVNSEVSIAVLCLPCSPRYTAVQLFEGSTTGRKSVGSTENHIVNLKSHQQSSVNFINFP